MDNFDASNALIQFAARLKGDVNKDDVRQILMTISINKSLPEFVRDAAIVTRASMTEEK